MLPEGASSWNGELSRDLSVTFDIPGVYGYQCTPHSMMAMVGVIHVGDNTSNLTSANVTLSSAGVLATTDFGGSSTTPTQYNFTIRITDQENQTADRSFSLTSSFGATGGV